MRVRGLRQNEWDELSDLIFHSTNDWYRKHLNRECFPGHQPSICRVFPEVYEDLDPDCCLVAEDEGKLIGSCFYHPRETHLSLGIMNVRSPEAGRGVAGQLLGEIISRAEGKPVRLVSSAMNLDSYSLYTRAGFRPTAVFQDMFFPAGKFLPAAGPHVRPVLREDISALVSLEQELVGIRRGKDYEYFVSNKMGIWHGYVFEQFGEIQGFLFSVNHSGSRMLGPGVMRDSKVALELLSAGLADFSGEAPIFLVPAKEQELIHELYQAGARNCEIHVLQALGSCKEPEGVFMPTFLPESG